MNRQIVRAVVGATLLSVAALAGAAEKSSEAASTAAPAASTPKGAMGMRVYVDPETGALVDRPVTPEQKRAAEADAEANFSQDSDGLTEVTHPDGSVSKDLQGRFELATQAHKSADGSLDYSCNDAEHVAQGKHKHDSAAPAAPAQEVR